MYHKTEQVKLFHSLPLYDKVCQWLAADQCFTPGIPVTSTNDRPPQYNWNIFESGVTP